MIAGNCLAMEGSCRLLIKKTGEDQMAEGDFLAKDRSASRRMAISAAKLDSWVALSWCCKPGARDQQRDKAQPVKDNVIPPSTPKQQIEALLHSSPPTHGLTCVWRRPTGRTSPILPTVVPPTSPIAPDWIELFM